MANSSTYGTGPGETTFDYATNAERQTGSAFKTFALMTLIHDQDGDPNQTYYDSHFLAPGWLPGYPTFSVHTSEETYQGEISVAHATTVSDNTVFAQLGVDLGMQNVDATAHAMGITAPLFGYPSEAIGGLRIGVSPLQMADAYATLANGGSHIPPTIIAKVVLPTGKTINLGNPTPHPDLLSQGEAYAGTQVLSTVVTSGTGTAANYGCPAAGKTGTTSNYTDAWFVGYTPELSTAVWVGYPNATTSMTDVNSLGPGFGGTLAAPIWRRLHGRRHRTATAAHSRCPRNTGRVSRTSATTSTSGSRCPSRRCTSDRDNAVHLPLPAAERGRGRRPQPAADAVRWQHRRRYSGSASPCAGGQHRHRLRHGRPVLNTDAASRRRRGRVRRRTAGPGVQYTADTRPVVCGGSSNGGRRQVSGRHDAARLGLVASMVV